MGAAIDADHKTHCERPRSAIFNVRARHPRACPLLERRDAGWAARGPSPAIVPRRGASSIIMSAWPWRIVARKAPAARRRRLTAERFLHRGNELLQRKWFRQETVLSRFRQMFLE